MINEIPEFNDTNMRALREIGEQYVGDSPLTPMQAVFLWLVAASLEDTVDWSKPSEVRWHFDLPQQTEYQDDKWFQQLRLELEILRNRIAWGEAQSPAVLTCTAHEVLMWAIIDEAEALQIHAVMERSGIADAAGISRSEYDHDWEGPRSDLFEDHDFLMLRNPRLDGIASDTELIEWLGNDLLAPAQWFTEFRSGGAA